MEHLLICRWIIICVVTIKHNFFHNNLIHHSCVCNDRYHNIQAQQITFHIHNLCNLHNHGHNHHIHHNYGHNHHSYVHIHHSILAQHQLQLQPRHQQTSYHIYSLHIHHNHGYNHHIHHNCDHNRHSYVHIHHSILA